MTEKNEKPKIQELPPVTSEQLAALKSGDENAWRRFLPQTTPIITRIVSWSKWHFVEQTKKDIFQRIQAALPQAIASFAGNASVHTLIRKISVYQCIDEVRRQVRRREIFVDDALETEEREFPGTDEFALRIGEQFNPVQAILKQELTEMVEKVLTSLSALCAEVLRLCYLEGLTYKEMAARLGVSINTIGPRLAGCYGKWKEGIRNDPVLRDYFFN
jgi:RNA polymerase sigma-70 factor (ECF subfamily)